MSTVKVKAIEPCDGKNPGDVFEVGEHQANQLVALGLVKMDGPPQNKMMTPASNKGNVRAAGKVQPSSVSPVAPVLPKTTAKPSGNGRRGPRGKSSPSTTATK